MNATYDPQGQMATAQRLLQELQQVLGGSVQILLLANPLAPPTNPEPVAKPQSVTIICPMKGSEEKIRLRTYSITQTAQALGVGISSVRRLIRRGLLRPSRTLRHLRIPVEQIDELLRTTTE